MKRLICLIFVPFAAISGAAAQSVMEDVFSGKLIDPEVGVYAWYELHDKSTEQTLYLRQAVVGQERVRRQNGFWVETEVIPQVGFPVLYKMLLTGPANDPRNVHEVIVKEGHNPPESVPLDDVEEEAPPAAQEQRESRGMTEVTTPQGTLEAEHVIITRGESRIEIWINDEVRPLGIVKMVTQDGELVLQRYGKGGEDAESRLSPESVGATPAPEQQSESRVQVRVEGEVQRNFSGRGLNND